MSLTVTASYATDPAESTDNHVLCDVEVTNTGRKAVAEVDLQAVEPLQPPYGAGIFTMPFPVGAGKTVRLQVGAHIAPDLAPSKPEFTATPFPELTPPS